MGRDLAEAFPQAAEVFEEADERLGFSLSRLAWEGPPDDLTLTRNAQPALLVHSVAVLKVIGAELGEVTMAAGHSLGEFSAHVAAGTLGFEDALAAVRLRGELMFASGLKRPGTMAAIIGLEDDVVAALCERVEGIMVPANYNAPGQVVVSGELAAVEAVQGLAREAGAKRVYFASAAPPVRYPNVYGIDMPAASELVAAGRTEEEVARIIGADWLIYQDLEDLVRAVQHHDSQVTEFDTSCFSGEYVTGDVTPEYLARLQAERSDLAKAQRNAAGAGRGPLRVVGGP